MRCSGRRIWLAHPAILSGPNTAATGLQQVPCTCRPPSHAHSTTVLHAMLIRSGSSFLGHSLSTFSHPEATTLAAAFWDPVSAPQAHYKMPLRTTYCWVLEPSSQGFEVPGRSNCLPRKHSRRPSSFEPSTYLHDIRSLLDCQLLSRPADCPPECQQGR